MTDKKAGWPWGSLHFQVISKFSLEMFVIIFSLYQSVSAGFDLFTLRLFSSSHGIQSTGFFVLVIFRWQPAEDSGFFQLVHVRLNEFYIGPANLHVFFKLPSILNADQLIYIIFSYLWTFFPYTARLFIFGAKALRKLLCHPLNLVLVLNSLYLEFGSKLDSFLV